MGTTYILFSIVLRIHAKVYFFEHIFDVVLTLLDAGGVAPGAPPIIKMWFPEKCSKEEVLIFFDFS